VYAACLGWHRSSPVGLRLCFFLSLSVPPSLPLSLRARVCVCVWPPWRNCLAFMPGRALHCRRLSKSPDHPRTRSYTPGIRTSHPPPDNPSDNSLPPPRQLSLPGNFLLQRVQTTVVSPYVPLKVGNVTSAGWQVTLDDTAGMRTSRFPYSGVTTLRTAVPSLLTGSM